MMKTAINREFNYNGTVILLNTVEERNDVEKYTFELDPDGDDCWFEAVIDSELAVKPIDFIPPKYLIQCLTEIFFYQKEIIEDFENAVREENKRRYPYLY